MCIVNNSVLDRLHLAKRTDKGSVVLIPSRVAVILVVPTAIKVAIPVGEIVAIAVLLLVQIT